MQSKPLKPKVVIGKNVPGGGGILKEIMLFMWSYTMQVFKIFVLFLDCKELKKRRVTHRSYR